MNQLPRFRERASILAIYWFGVRDSNPVDPLRHPAESLETPENRSSGTPPLGGSGALSDPAGTFPGTLVERSIRTAIAAALEAADYTTAEGLIALLKATAKPGAEVVEFAARRSKGA